MERGAAVGESSQLLAILVASSPLPIVAFNREGNITLWNAAAERVFGWTADEVLGRPLPFIPPEKAAEHRAMRARDLEGQGFTGREIHRRRKDGSPVDLNVSTAPMRDPHGEITGIVSIYEDITERKRIEAALRQQADLLDLAHDAILSMDLEGCIRFWNRGAEKLYGWTREEATGQLAAELLRPESPVSFTELQSILLRDSIWEGEITHTCRNRSRVVVSSRWAVRRGADGEPTGFLEINRDLTERKRIETQLRETAKLESLGVLAGGIAHDFNNLLTGIIGSASLALESMPEDRRERDLIADVVATGERAADLTRQMLAYAGRGQFVIEPVNVSRLVSEISHLVRMSLPKHVRLTLDLAPALPAVEADRGQIQQIVMNLVINAAESITAERAGRVDVSTSILEWDARAPGAFVPAEPLTPGQYFVLEVRDNGSGIDPSTLPRIFDPFFTSKFTGRGLGLSAVLGIVRAHRGALLVYSEVGKGSRFQVWFPAADYVAREAAPQSAPSRTVGRGTILVVDDEETVRRSAKAALERHGFRVLLADDGARALEVLRTASEPVALVILDLTMPGPSTQATLDSLHAMHPELKVILSSGYNQSDVAPPFGAAARSFLQKPYTSTRLIEQVTAALGHSE
jgi:PAS domain S-box-containing protein